MTSSATVRFSGRILLRGVTFYDSELKWRIRKLINSVITLTVRSKFGRGQVKVLSLSGQNSPTVRSKYSVRSKFTQRSGQSTLNVRSKYAHGQVKVRSRSGKNSLTVRFW